VTKINVKNELISIMNADYYLG